MISRIIIIAIAMLLPFAIQAQDPNQPFQQDQTSSSSNPPVDPAGPPPPNDAPIDGGITLLLAAGAAYGVKKYRDSRKNEEL